MHYARSTADMWPSLMKLAKEGGLDMISSYVFWNLHEITDSTGAVAYDFDSGRRNLTGFLEEAKRQDLYVFLRIGPFVCSEWNYGGIPTRLRTISSNYSADSKGMMAFRSLDPAWKNEMTRFVKKVVDVCRSYFASAGGPVLLVQVENEYGNVEPFYGHDGPRYAQWAADLMQSMVDTTGVPTVMCQQQGVTGVIQSCNGFYCDPPDSSTRTYPALFTEMWSGWFMNWGDSVPHR